MRSTLPLPLLLTLALAFAGATFGCFDAGAPCATDLDCGGRVCLAGFCGGQLLNVVSEGEGEVSGEGEGEVTGEGEGEITGEGEGEITGEGEGEGEPCPLLPLPLQIEGNGAVELFPPTGCGSPFTAFASQTLELPAHTVLGPFPGAGAAFQSWGGACSGNGGCTFEAGDPGIDALFSLTDPELLLQITMDHRVDPVIVDDVAVTTRGIIAALRYPAGGVPTFAAEGHSPVSTSLPRKLDLVRLPFTGHSDVVALQSTDVTFTHVLLRATSTNLVVVALELQNPAGSSLNLLGQQLTATSSPPLQPVVLLLLHDDPTELVLEDVLTFDSSGPTGVSGIDDLVVEANDVITVMLRGGSPASVLSLRRILVLSNGQQNTHRFSTAPPLLVPVLDGDVSQVHGVLAIDPFSDNHDTLANLDVAIGFLPSGPSPQVRLFGNPLGSIALPTGVMALVGLTPTDPSVTTTVSLTDPNVHGAFEPRAVVPTSDSIVVAGTSADVGSPHTRVVVVDRALRTLGTSFRVVGGSDNPKNHLTGVVIDDLGRFTVAATLFDAAGTNWTLTRDGNATGQATPLCGAVEGLCVFAGAGGAGLVATTVFPFSGSFADSHVVLRRDTVSGALVIAGAAQGATYGGNLDLGDAFVMRFAP